MSRFAGSTFSVEALCIHVHFDWVPIFLVQDLFFNKDCVIKMSSQIKDLLWLSVFSASIHLNSSKGNLVEPSTDIAQPLQQKKPLCNTGKTGKGVISTLHRHRPAGSREITIHSPGRSSCSDERTSDDSDGSSTDWNGFSSLQSPGRWVHFTLRWSWSSWLEGWDLFHPKMMWFYPCSVGRWVNRSLRGCDPS